MAKVPVEEVIRFSTDCFKALGVNAKAACQQADMLYQADRIGYFSHGLNRLEFYVNDVKNGACTPNKQPKVEKETVSMAWVNANNVFGSTASHFSMDLAIKKAKCSGVGWVCVKESNHYGIGGYWAMKAAKQGLMAFALSNSSPLLVPTRSKKAVLGTNPIAFVAPGCDDDYFYLDFATTAVSMGKIAFYARKGRKLPDGWALGPNGKMTNDPKEAMKARQLMPLGGTESSSGYKGYGLAAMVEVLCGITAGSKYGHHIRSWVLSNKSGGSANLGHAFIVMDPHQFAPGFKERVSECLSYWRNMEPADPKLPVIAPGDMEKLVGGKTDREGTITYIKRILEHSRKIAKDLKVKPLKEIPL
ncbi:PREDICTED: uncharacterized oxidoreductase YjmC-like [Papilio polytes]|uniref:uncharacterized oxidoreductase YjmC-like n=1 Tax=Papilio polytes TaxID=76194 RepID=UPI000675D067|nr:PREDICTED: uncharacterized oxidoreductase YjmC-like [Papilio polytes]XP_013137127.1 PREDICTED: uncharacterized oxidoreductase YjmC-like [Papilio polytes]